MSFQYISICIRLFLPAVWGGLFLFAVVWVGFKREAQEGELWERKLRNQTETRSPRTLNIKFPLVVEGVFSHTHMHMSRTSLECPFPAKVKSLSTFPALFCELAAMKQQVGCGHLGCSFGSGIGTEEMAHRHQRAQETFSAQELTVEAGIALVSFRKWLTPLLLLKTSSLFYSSSFRLDQGSHFGQENVSRHDKSRSFKCACVTAFSLRLLWSAWEEHALGNCR